MKILEQYLEHLNKTYITYSIPVPDHQRELLLIYIGKAIIELGKRNNV